MKTEMFRYVGNGCDIPVIHVTLITLGPGDNYKHRNNHFQGPVQLAVYDDVVDESVWCSFKPNARHQFEIIEKILSGPGWKRINPEER